jgi:hypothetical protein
MEEDKNAYRIFMGKPQGSKHLEDQTLDTRVNNKADLVVLG